MDRAQRAKALFQKWLDARVMDDETPNTEAMCGDEPELLPELEKLIGRFREIDRALPSPSRPGLAPGTPDDVPREPPRVARYRVLGQLGEGGMGEVWEAEQEEPIQRRVALKVIKRGLDTDRVIRRFESERQALASMDHPAIARVYEAGATADGRPYFAMELVRGTAITDFCDQNRLSTRERLELFARICDGVQHAHQKGEIHRDLKPSNIMVALDDTDPNGQPQPKIIDFGVAKAITPGTVEAVTLTQLGQLVGTPAYMSPEQADLANLDIDTRSDVYSLGVILYELLVGARPFPGESTAGTLSRSKLDRDPPTPSSKITALGTVADDVAARHNTKSSTLVRALRGDLDWVTLKALANDREQRYSSPQALADDLRRHFRDEPVLAGPPTATYRLKKFARRHRVAMAVATILTLAVGIAVAGLAVGLDHALKAERRATTESEVASRVSEFLVELFEQSSPTSNTAGEATARELLDRGAERIDEELADQPLVRARLMESMGRAYKGLGLYDASETLLDDALALRKADSSSDPLDVARVLYERADLSIDTGDFAAAETASLEASALRASLGKGHLDYALSRNQLGLIRWRQGEFAEARELLEEALAIKEAALGDGHIELAPLLNNVAILYWEARDLDRAQTLFERGLTIFEGHLGPDHPNVASNLNNVAMVQQETGDIEGAIANHRKALAIREDALEPNHPYIAESLNNLGNPLAEIGELEEAESVLRRAMGIREAALGPNHPDLATTFFNLGNVLMKREDFDQARPLVTRALAMFEAAVGPEHPAVAYPVHALAFLDWKAGNHVAAEANFRRALTIREGGLGPDHPLQIDVLNELATMLEELGRDEEAMVIRARTEHIQGLVEAS